MSTKIKTSLQLGRAPSTPGEAVCMNKLAFTVEETMHLLSVGRTKIYSLSKKGLLPITKIDSKSVFLASNISKFVAELQREGDDNAL